MGGQVHVADERREVGPAKAKEAPAVLVRERGYIAIAVGRTGLQMSAPNDLAEALEL